MTFWQQIELLFKMLGAVMPFILVAAVIVAISQIPTYIRNNRLKKAGILDTDTMSGVEFEKWLQIKFKEMGYKVKRTPATGDGGADLILNKDGKRIAVQAKKSSGQKIGVKAVSEVLRGKMVYDCDEAMVVTNQYFTKSACRDAKKCNVKLMNRDDLLRMVERINKQREKTQSKKAG